ncbi:MAG TPA: DUF4270 family protein [Chitinophagaceae bacterium]|nr:DUF4270 family protein [Chitinophagaceae bacterium]
MNIFPGMKKRLFYTVPFFLFVMVACQKKSISFGEEFAESFTNILQIDTLTAALSTYRLDSFSTSGTGVAIVGKFSDIAFGTTTTASYQQLGIPRAIPDISINAVYDSLTLILTPTKEYYGDTTLTQQLNVHELTQTLAFAPEKTQFYNTNSFSYDPTPLGSRSFTLQPNRTDSVEIRLTDMKGNDLFTKLRNKDNDVTAQESFLRYFKGIALQPSVSSSSLINYKVTDSAFRMRLYYHEPGPDGPNNLYIEFPVTNTQLQFNQMVLNRNAAPLNSLPASGFPEVPSASLDHKAYLQDPTGLLAKVTFPSLQNLLFIDTSGKILKAELIIKPLPGSYDKTIYRMPPVINLGVVDKNNTLVPSNGLFLSANLAYDDLYGDNTGYVADITPFLQRELRVNQEIRNGLLIYTPANAAFNRLIIGDKTTGKYGIQVKIYYLVIK